MPHSREHHRNTMFVGRGDDFRLRRARAAIANIFGQGAGEENAVLHHDADLPPYRLDVVVGDGPVIDDDLRETDFGDWDGFTLAEIEQRWPVAVARWRRDPGQSPPGGESFAAAAQRNISYGRPSAPSPSSVSMPVPDITTGRGFRRCWPTRISAASGSSRLACN